MEVDEDDDAPRWNHILLFIILFYSVFLFIELILVLAWLVRNSSEQRPKQTRVSDVCPFFPRARLASSDLPRNETCKLLVERPASSRKRRASEKRRRCLEQLCQFFLFLAFFCADERRIRELEPEEHVVQARRAQRQVYGTSHVCPD
jgi:hypothetical protein